MNDIKDFWEKRSIKYQGTLEGVLPKSFPRPVNECLDRWTFDQIDTLIKHGKVNLLDLGCGYGRLAGGFIRKYQEITVEGIDIADNYVRIFNQDLNPRGKAQVGEITKLPFKDETFDLSYIVATLMYIKGPKKQKEVIGEILRVTKKGGFIVVIERNKLINNIINIGGIVEWIRGTANREIPAISFRDEDIVELFRGKEAKLLAKTGIPFWTANLPFVYLLSKINEQWTRRYLTAIMYLDQKLTKFYNLSLYICYKYQRE